MDRQDFLPNITAEDRKLIKLFQEEVNRINLLYLKAIHSNDITKANQLLKQMKSISDYLSKTYWKWADIRIPQEYVKWSTYIDEVLGSAILEALTEEEIRTYLNELWPIHIEAVNALLNNSKNYVKSSLDWMERQALTMINELQQEKVREELAKWVISWEARMNDRVIKYFTDNGINWFKDRGGKFRSMDRYVDMLVRTETSIANTQGTINRALELGITKFWIIEHPDCCKECAEMNWDIVDISQWTVELPPFHPNCRWYIVAVLDEEDWKESLLRMEYDYNHKANTPEEKVKKALDVIENSTMYLEHEQVAYVSLKGEVIKMASWETWEVSLIDNWVNEPYILTHNHPNSGPVSLGDLKSRISSKNEYWFRASSKIWTYSLYAENKFDRALFMDAYEKLYDDAVKKAENDIYSIVKDKEVHSWYEDDYMIMKDWTYFYKKDNPLEFDRIIDEHIWKYYREALQQAANEVQWVKYEFIPSNWIENENYINKMYLDKVKSLKNSNNNLEEDKSKIMINYYL